MAELPEIMVLSSQMNNELKSKEIKSVDVIQEKCLNMDVGSFKERITGKTIKNVYNKGKWIFFELTDSYHLLLNLGMGSDVLYHNLDECSAEEYQCRFNFTDNSGFTCKFWWFGHIDLVSDKELSEHKATKDIAISPLDPNFTLDYFKKVCSGRAMIKNVILNQKKVGGIGNVYIHDILFKSKLHPKKTTNSLEPSQINDLFQIMVENLKYSLDKKGLAYEKDFYGKNGEFSKDYFLVAYKEGEKCPDCSKIIEKIKTGSTSSYICPECQKL
ncbi:DNA-formamidopyrimidine glycosylase family protein [Methanobacterium sp.]|uniref:DNA-formamidopyrimidine glycosylase family protein n=1 Tax=Methanobacterium sp. TaxID=2164 RepID=UPI0031598E95